MNDPDPMRPTSTVAAGANSTTIGHEDGEPESMAGVHGDYDDRLVPLDKRRSPTTMFLIWATLQASVSVMFTGFLARSQGLSLGQLMTACAIGTVAILLYGFAAANLGAATGQTHTLLSRTIFGKVGSGIVSVLLIIMGLGWYGFQARFLAQMLDGLFTLQHLTYWAVGFAILMMFNNLFGFRGVAAWARFVAAPILLTWGAYALIKGLVHVSGRAAVPTPHVSAPITIMVVVGLLVGSAAWGNEPDIFRFSFGKPLWNVPALVGGYVIGIFLFPLAGYLLAELSSAADLGPFVRFIVSFSLFGVTAFGVILLVANQFALNDGNLYEGVNAFQNLMDKVRFWKRWYSVVLLGGLGAVLAAIMQSLEKNFFIVAGISATFVPCATVIMAMDVFILPRVAKIRRSTHQVTPWESAATGNTIGLVALLVGGAVGAYTGGLIPGLSGFGTTTIGFPALQAWVTSGVVYVILALAVPRSRQRELLGFPVASSDVQIEADNSVPEVSVVARSEASRGVQPT